MKFLPPSWARVLCLSAGLVAMASSSRAADLIPAGLEALAATSSRPETWQLLRNYAQSQPEPEWNGWAYFLAGFKEYEGQHYPAAVTDLAQAAVSGFTLADYAIYYEALALDQGGQPQKAAGLLGGFASRFPQSRLHILALTLRANTLMEAQEQQQAADMLSAEPASRTQPGLALLLGKAYVQGHRPAEAALAFQTVYYNFPASAQAKTAADALRPLRIQLGPAYPVPDEALSTARADALLKAGRYADALKDYSALRRDRPSSPRAPEWRMGEARCLLRLRRSADALQELFEHFDTPEREAQRLELLVEAHVQQSDAPGITQELARLDTTYPDNPAYADALSQAGAFYFRQFNWAEASRNYGRLAELFPRSDHLREDAWRLAWCDYLLGDPQTSALMNKYLMQFPDSPRAPAALYWLGRAEEQQGVLPEARALYALLVKRFVHTYYAPRAAARLAAIGSKQVSAPAPGDPGATPLASALVPVLAPRVVPAGLGCLPAWHSEAARPALILQALNLKNLEEDYLKSALAADNPPTELRLLLAELYTAEGNANSALFAALRAVPAYPQMDFSDLPGQVWDFLYPQAYWKLIEQEARTNNLDPYLVMGLVRQESAFSPGALSSANARGLMQVLPETAARSNRPSRTRVAARRLYDPAYNVRIGCAYFADLLKSFDAQPELALAAYNAGDSRVRDWVKRSPPRETGAFLESIPFSATRIYVEMVLRDAEIYRQLLSGSPHFAQCPAPQPSLSRPAAKAVPRGGLPARAALARIPGQ